ncbi:UTP--glucose-1-phosphate uridylyltransferase [Roseivivax halotolerans]|uniref:UTP--glucose-1-phosphate uridylyltransferase n=1 Tax=Roseivivax halotolerans TaxID=93684 RepID=A0A1I6AM25_9RHOB|nr:UTP--glucose-1-phosphate uridylyltransferase [Roseivivax halotolerans]
MGDEPFAVLLPDDVIPALAQMVGAHTTQGGHMIATEEVPANRISSYGVVDIARQQGAVQALRGLVEKPKAEDAPSRFGIVGRYILEPSIFDGLVSQKPGSGGEIQLTDAIASDLRTAGVNGFAFDGERFDCGSVPGYLEATIAFALDRPELCNGVSQFFAARSTGNLRAA